MYNFAFPLVQIIVDELLESFNDDKFFIDIRKPGILNSDSALIGIAFDRYMNRLFLNKSKKKLFEFKRNDIEIINIDYLIKKKI